MTTVLEPAFCFGLKADVRDNICFLDEQTVLYPAGSSLIVYNVDTRTQRFIQVRATAPWGGCLATCLPTTRRAQGNEGAVHTAMAVSPNRRYLAVAEQGEVPSVSVYDLHTLKRRKTLAARDTSATSFGCLCFSPDSKYLVTLSGSPDWTLSYWAWEKSRDPMASVRVSTQADVAAYQVG